MVSVLAKASSIFRPRVDVQSVSASGVLFVDTVVDVGRRRPTIGLNGAAGAATVHASAARQGRDVH
jgi:hypothetical protein